MNIPAMINQTLVLSLPILIAGLGGLFCERSGVANIALEGLMMMGAFTAAALTTALEPFTGAAAWIAVAAGLAAGLLFSFIHAYLTITLKADQIISATALNFFAFGLTIYLCEMIFGQQRTVAFQRGFTKISVPVLRDIPILGDALFSNVYPPVYLGAALLAASWFALYKTRFGLRLRAAGEHPHAVDSAGVNVAFVRYRAVALSGAFAGLAGGVMVLTQDTQYSGITVHGTGYIALAALIFGQWRPLGLAAASLFFGFSQILALYSNNFGILKSVPFEFFKAFPYVLTIIALVAFSKKAIMPKALGIPYQKGER